MPEVAIVLLAAGESRRLGEPKQLLELDGVPHEVAEGAFERAAAKLPIKTKFITRIGDA